MRGTMGYILSIASCTYIHALNSSLKRPIESMGRARLLDKKSSIWARTVYSMACRVNGRDAEWMSRPIYSKAHRRNSLYGLKQSVRLGNNMVLH